MSAANAARVAATGEPAARVAGVLPAFPRTLAAARTAQALDPDSAAQAQPAAADGDITINPAARGNGKTSKPKGKAKAKATKTLAKPGPAEPARQMARLAEVATANAFGDVAAGDDLKLIGGIGPRIEARLHSVGVTRFSQIAAWTKRERAEMGTRLAFPGRIEREDWVGQAKVLAGTGRPSRREAKDKAPAPAAAGKSGSSAKQVGAAAPAASARKLSKDEKPAAARKPAPARKP
ncbi:putative flap endonuclease-1-like 5' DNA nuclease [Hoeflea marina]|uniref:Putative flap endonuclease-1-like 5' DNA nuclease n=2 Tax=Hoeflea marina TaxID=274592 RepID=A0A317PFK1_9HYPH|nr:putative flap endonuclease-1-like 5' DNA nuclease [Hoeflea marina]